MMQERATDFRLDSTLRDACEEDIKDTCGWREVRHCINSPAAASPCLAQTLPCWAVSCACIGPSILPPVAHKSVVENRSRLQDLGDDESQIVSCLQDFRDTLWSKQCREEVHKVMARASEDIRFNQMLADDCYNDRAKFCSNTQQVSCTCHPAFEQASE